MKRTILVVLAVATLALVPSTPGHARGHGHFGASIWIGPGWGPGWWGPAYPYYAAPPVIVQQPPVIIERQPDEYMQQVPQPEEKYYWYYCPDAKGYYPYVKKCPKGWLKVVPSPEPPDGEE
jgi:hypothetical protein